MIALIMLLAANSVAPVPAAPAPESVVPAEAVSGRPLVLGERNIVRAADDCAVAQIKLKVNSDDGNAGDFYFNWDGNHSDLVLEEFPGLTKVSLDQPAKAAKKNMGFPSLLLPYPTFGNASLAFVQGSRRVSFPRAMMTRFRAVLPTMVRLYKANQFYVFPSVDDTPPIGTQGDLFPSVAPYWLVSAGRSGSDQPYLKAALEVSRSLDPAVKRELVKRGLLAPTIQALVRKSLKGVADEAAYLTPAAHPTAFPPNGLDLPRLVKNAGSLTTNQIPPLATVDLKLLTLMSEELAPGEVTYATDHACAVVLRSPDRFRSFRITAKGGDEYAFVQTHGDRAGVRINAVLDVANVLLDRTKVTPTNRIDIAVMARSRKSGWGAPSYVSFAVPE